MKPTRTLPDDFDHTATLDLSRERLLVGLNLIGLILLVAGGWLVFRLVMALRPDLPRASLTLESAGSLVLGALAAAFLTLVLHEAAHGLFFWIFTGEKPEFGMRGAYAFAAAPSWYLPRDQFLVVGIAPLALISPFGVALALVAPGQVAWVALLVAIINTAGAVGDLAVVAWLLQQPRGVLVNDQGERFVVYAPLHPQA